MKWPIPPPRAKRCSEYLYTGICIPHPPRANWFQHLFRGGDKERPLTQDELNLYRWYKETLAGKRNEFSLMWIEPELSGFLWPVSRNMQHRSWYNSVLRQLRQHANYVSGEVNWRDSP